MEKKFLLNSVSQSSQALYPGLRRKLDTKYRSFVKGKTASLPFPIFIDLPSIRKFWRPVGASRSAINRNWPEETVSVVQTEMQKASHWVELSYARNLAQALRRLQKPLAPSVYSSLNPENALLPPSTYTGIDDPLSTSGLLFDDPATISQQQLNDLLDKFSHQAWHFDSEIPQSFISVQINNFDRLNAFEYRGPLFPYFNTFWHQILLQILDKTGVQDGPSKATTTILKGLKTTFACGVCSVTEKKTAKKNFVNLVSNFPSSPAALELSSVFLRSSNTSSITMNLTLRVLPSSHSSSTALPLLSPENDKPTLETWKRLPTRFVLFSLSLFLPPSLQDV
jgi:hypothetical protein